LTAAENQGRDLYVSPGIYHYRTLRYCRSGLRMRGADASTCVFKSIGNANGCFTFTAEWDPGAEEPFTQISFERVGFDLNGATSNFLSVIAVRGREEPATHVTVRDVKAFDSVLGDTMYTARDRQRQYIVVLNCEDVLIEDNDLSAGGRIKTGGPGRRMIIRRNHLFNVNDNGITIADNQGSGVTESVLIEDNTIINPIAAGIFYGADGEDGGAPGQALYDVTIRGNQILGDFGSAGIWGMMPDHAARIHVFDNSICRTGDTGQWVMGLGFGRANGAFYPTEDVMVERNQISTVPPGNYDDLAGIFVRGTIQNFCLVDNDVTPMPTALWVHGPVLAKLSGNDFHGGGIRVDSGGAVDSTADMSGCFRPTEVSAAPPLTDGDGAGGRTGPVLQIVPSPFRRDFEARWPRGLAVHAPISADLYSLSGRLILRRGGIPAQAPDGAWSARFRVGAGELPSGMYVVRVQAGGVTTSRMVLHVE